MRFIAIEPISVKNELTTQPRGLAPNISKQSKPDQASRARLEIESGAADTSNAHIKVGSHFPVYFELIYYGEENTDKIQYVYYPILSAEHPFVQGLATLYEKYIPEEKIPQVGEFSVLVKSKRYSNTSELPEGFDEAESVQGLVINKISNLKDEELDLLRQSFPSLNPEKILVLEEGRKPAGAAKKFGMIGGGGLLSLVGLGWLVVGFRKK